MGNSKNLAEVIGLPDAQDKLRIQLYFKKYEQEHPGELKFHRDAARERLTDPKYGIVDQQSARRYLFELPVPVGHWLGEAYPTLFKSKENIAWFCKNFPELLIPEKY